MNSSGNSPSSSPEQREAPSSVARSIVNRDQYEVLVAELTLLTRNMDSLKGDDYEFRSEMVGRFVNHEAGAADYLAKEINGNIESLNRLVIDLRRELNNAKGFSSGMAR